jgi:hypothetical protein
LMVIQSKLGLDSATLNKDNVCGQGHVSTANQVLFSSLQKSKYFFVLNETIYCPNRVNLSFCH